MKDTHLWFFASAGPLALAAMTACGGSSSPAPLGGTNNNSSGNPGSSTWKTYPYYVYISTPGASTSANGEVFCYGVQEDGTLVANGTAMSTGVYPFALAASRDGKHLLIANQGGADPMTSKGSVSSFNIGEGGRLSAAAGSPFAAGAYTESVTVDPTSQFVYAANPGVGSGNHTLSGWKIASDGVLTSLDGFPYNLSEAAYRLDSSPISTSGFLHVGFLNKLQIYMIASDGKITPGSAGTSGTFGLPYGITFDDYGYGFVTGSGNVVSPYVIDDGPWTQKINGTELTAATGLPGATAVVEDGVHGFVFVADEGGDNITGFPRAAGGKISSTDSVTTNGVGNPYKLALHPLANGYLYVAGQYGTLRTLKVNQDGTLTELQKLDLESSPSDIAIVSK